MRKSDFPLEVPIHGRVRICLEMLKQQNPHNKVIVDIGSSFGWLEKEIVKMRPKKVIGIEPSTDAVNFAKKTVKGAEFVVGHAGNIDIQDNFADIVIMYDVIEHIPPGTEQQTLDRLYKILKKDGLLLLSTPFDNFFSKFLDPAWYLGHRHYSQESLKNMFKKAGFTINSIESKGSIWSSVFLLWFYSAKILTGKSQPRNDFLERMDDEGYNYNNGITDIFVVAKKV